MPKQGWDHLDRSVDTDERFLSFEDGHTRNVRVLDEEPFCVLMHQIRGEVAGEERFISVAQTEDRNDDWIDEVSGGRFAARRRFFVRVFDHDTESVRVFAGGPTVFKDLRNMDRRAREKGSTICDIDIDITRDGEGRDTKWSVSFSVESIETDVEQWRAFADELEGDFHPDRLFPPIDRESQKRIVEESGIDIFTDPAEAMMEKLDYDSALGVTVPFGKHQGKTVGEIMEVDRGWIAWASGNVTSNAEVAAAARVVMARVQESQGLPSGASRPTIRTDGTPRPLKAQTGALPPSGAPSSDAKERLEAMKLVQEMLQGSTPIERVKAIREATGGKKAKLADLTLDECNALVESLA